MTAKILVATPHTAFGELLRSSLADSGEYQVQLVQSGKEVQVSARQGQFQVAIVDSSLTDEPFVPLCKNLILYQPGIRLVIIPPENDPNHASLGGLMPHAYLARPFYLPDLLDIVSSQLTTYQNQNQPAENPELPSEPPPSSILPRWLQEPNTFQTYLEEELQETRALAAIAGQFPSGSSHDSPAKDMIRAYAGNLDQSAVNELFEMIYRSWNRTEKTDLMRFVRLATGKLDVLIYATPIIHELVLILVYDSAAPLSQIRPQTKSIAQSLANQPPRKDRVDVTPQDKSLIDNSPLPENLSESRNILAETCPEAGASSTLPAAPITNIPDKFEDESGEKDGSLVATMINMSALLGSVPPPDPEADAWSGKTFSNGSSSHRSANVPIPTLPGSLNGNNASFPSSTVPLDGQTGEEGLAKLSPQLQPDSANTRQECPPALPVDYALPVGKVSISAEPAARDDQPTITNRPASLDVPTEPPVKTPGIPTPVDPRQAKIPTNLLFEPDPPSNILEDTHPHVISTISNLNQLESASPALSLLNYTCVLVPRLPQHYLTGELADRLAGWVQQLCLAFGWRLEGIAIRPEYLQWTIQVAPSISPGNLVRIIRQRTSLHIFGNYPHFADQNPSGDFWAIGYLIVSGAQPPSAQLLRDYIAQTRKRQGANK